MIVHAIVNKTMGENFQRIRQLELTFENQRFCSEHFKYFFLSFADEINNILEQSDNCSYIFEKPSRCNCDYFHQKCATVQMIALV